MKILLSLGNSHQDAEACQENKVIHFGKFEVIQIFRQGLSKGN